MSYRVKIESFEGPFELLLALVTQQKVKIGSISISEIADQYLEYVEEMQELDLDVASEFLIVASTLLSMKAKALLPSEEPSSEDGDELEKLTLEQAADLLAERVLTYYQFKRIAWMLDSRMQNESMMHPRQVGPDPEFLGLLPDYLEGVALEGLAVVCASLMAKRETFLLDAKHIAAKPIAVETYVDSITKVMREKRHITFDEILEESRDTVHIVVSFLAILEMYKRGMIDLNQADSKSPINIDYIDPSKWNEFADIPDMDGSEETDAKKEYDDNDLSVSIDNDGRASDDRD